MSYKALRVPEAGLEPARDLNSHWILSPTCLPIPPLGLVTIQKINSTDLIPWKAQNIQLILALLQR